MATCSPIDSTFTTPSVTALAELQLAGAQRLFPGAVILALATAFVMRDEYSLQEGARHG